MGINPNITGTYAPGVRESANTGVHLSITLTKSGVFSDTVSKSVPRYIYQVSTLSEDKYDTGVKFSADASNSLYGMSTSVQNPAIASYTLIKV